MKLSIMFLVGMIFGFVGGALAHEKDIQRSCAKHGYSGYSTWEGNLACKPIPKID